VQSSNYLVKLKNVCINFVNYNLNTHRPYSIVLTVLRSARGFPEQVRSTSSSVFHDNAMPARTLSEVDKRMHHWEGA